jgi:O-antigen ligase
VPFGPQPSADAPERTTHISRWLPVAATAVLTTFSIAFPRSAAVVFLIPVGVALILMFTDPDRRDLRVPMTPLLLAFIIFSGWSLFSATWSAAPLASLSKPLFLLGGAIGTAVLLALAGRDGAAEFTRIGLGILVGLLIGGLLLCVETITDQAISRFFYNILPKLRVGQEKHLEIQNGIVVGIAENNINRRSTVVALLLLPGALMLAQVYPMRWRRLALGALIAIANVQLIMSGHQSSQAAILVGGVAFLLALASRTWALRLVAVAWCVSCLLIVPIVTLVHSTDLHKDDKGLFLSARHRIVIWNYTAQQVSKAPWFGIGADATAAKTKARETAGGSPIKDGAFDVTAARHAHNVFLQTWYELGAVGAILLMLVGLSALAAISSLPAAVQPFLIGQFAAVAGMIAFSFSMWQLWFQGAIGIGILALVAGIRARSTTPEPANDP